MWVQVWALEAAGAAGDERWLERDPEQWMRGRAGYEAQRHRVARPRAHERVAEMIEGWPGRYAMPPFGPAIALFRRKGRRLSEAEWGAASALEERMEKERDEETLAQRTEARARQMHAEIEQCVRQGALKAYGSEGLEAARQAWAQEPTLRGTPAAAVLREKPEERYTSTPGDRRRVGWVVPYDSAERLLCAAAASHRQPATVMERSRAMHLTPTMEDELAVHGTWLRKGAREKEATREELEAVERVQHAANGQRS